MSNDVVVGGTAIVVTRKEGQEGNDAVLISALNTTQKSGVMVGEVRRVAIA